jgi:hypothetical protein
MIMRRFWICDVATIALGLTGCAPSSASDCSRADVMESAARIFWHRPAGEDARLLEWCEHDTNLSAEVCKAIYTHSPTMQDVSTDRTPANGDTVIWCSGTTTVLAPNGLTAVATTNIRIKYSLKPLDSGGYYISVQSQE